MPSLAPIRSVASRRLVSALAVLWLAPGVLAADERQSLQERRLGVIKGTSAGIVILDLSATKPTPTVPSASASASASARMPAAATGVAATAPAPAGWASRWLGGLPPPSGRSLQDARRLDAPDQGIPLPTAASASAAASAPPQR